MRSPHTSPGAIPQTATERKEEEAAADKRQEAADKRQEAADKRQEAADRRADARRVREEDRRADARRESEDRVPAARAKAAARVRAAVDGDADLATRIEKATWNWTLRAFPPRDRYWDNARLRFRYTTKILSVCFNVRHPLNPDLRASVLQGETGPGRLVRMSPYELFPGHWAEVFDRVAHKQLRKQITLDSASAPDGLLQCRKCKSRKTTYTQLQTRSADEPLTTFALCLECGARWKE